MNVKNKKIMVKVSVIMSIYSEPIEWMKEAINSILNQTFTDFEFIIVNDKPSRKENIELLKAYQQKDKRIQIVENNENIGLTKSLNKGLLLAKGTYIARMDADDFSYPTRFEKQVHFLDENKEYVVCGTNIEYFGDVQKEVFYPKENNMFLFLKSPFAHPVVMFRNFILDENNDKITYNESFKYAQDYELWSRFHNYGKFHNIQEILFKYRVSSQQISKGKLSEQQFYAGQTRRKMLNAFCENNNITYRIATVLDLNEIKRYEKEVMQVSGWNLAQRKALITFKYYLYRSVTKNYVSTLLHLITSFDIIKIGVVNSLKTSIYLLTKKLSKIVV